jgi:GTP-binding protein
MRIRDARYLASATDTGQLPPPAFAEVAFAGRSNVGKSSLMNMLLRRKKLVRTSGTPGCTRAINLFRVELAEPEATLDFVDLPGYGYAQRSKAERKSWGKLIEDFLANRPGLRGVVCIVDVRRGFEPDDLELIEFVEHVGVRPILVATKLDKLRANEQKLRLLALGKEMGRPVHGVSAETEEGREALFTAILRIAAIGPTAKQKGEDATADSEISEI